MIEQHLVDAVLFAVTVFALLALLLRLAGASWTPTPATREREREKRLARQRAWEQRKLGNRWRGT